MESTDYVHLDGIAMLDPMKKIRDIFCGDGFPKEEYVHIIITVPEPETTPVEDRKELHHLQKDQKELQKDRKELHHRRKTVEQLKNPFHNEAVAWNFDINTAILDMLSQLICKRYPEYEDSTLIFTFKLDESRTCTPETNEQLQELLSSLVVKDKMTVKISVETPAKSFSDWTLSEVMRSYEICDDTHIPDKKGKMKHGLLYFPESHPQ
ncbi:hypothetical protein BGX38DRAFT_1146642 [Terfezia claveryi]|nr:hypothetical protein BGX38DRAFT_1146642 [Terfezia claveryi]